jgi:hypothetical protein
MLLHLWLGGLGMYAVARRWTGLNIAAAVAGVAYALHGLVQQSLMWPNNIAAFGLLPWVVLTAERGVREGGRPLVIAALVGALQMLTGAPEVILFTWLLVVVVRVACCVTDGSDTQQATGSTHGSRLAALIALVAAISAAQLLPFLDLLRHSQRDAGYGGTEWSVPVLGAAHLVTPVFQTSFSAPGVPFQHGQKWTSSFYAGLPVLLLAIAALRRGCSPRVWVLAAVVVLGLAAAMGDSGWLYPALKQLLPLGAMRYTAKFIIPLTFALPLLAAFALRDLLPAQGQAAPPSTTVGRRHVCIIVAMLAAIVGIALHGWMRPLPWASADDQRRLLVGSLTAGVWLLMSVAILMGLARSGTRVRAMLLSFGLLALVAVDLKTHLPRITPRVSTAPFEGDHPLVQATAAPRAGGPRASITAQSLIEVNRTLLPSLSDTLLLQRVSLCANLNLLDGLAKTDGFFSLQPRHQFQVEPRLMFAGASNSLPAPFADFLGVAHVTGATNIFQWDRRNTARPLVTAGQRPEFSTAEHTLQTLGSTRWNPSETVFLPASDRERVPNTNAAPASIMSSKWTTHRIECEVESPAPTLVVIAQSYYHSWQATVNGQPAEILRANHAFQAVPVPAGRSTVRLEYVDRAFQLGVVLSALGLIACAVLWQRDARRVAP